MLRDQHIVCFSSIDWDAPWQVHQEVMSRLARGGSFVVFVENTGIRRAGVRDLPRLRQRVRNWRARRGGAAPPPGLRVISPVALPFPYSRAALAINRPILRRALAPALAGTRPVAWVFLPTPLVLDTLAALDPGLVVYHCADDFASSSAAAAPAAASEARLLQTADLVLATATRLEERARRLNAHVHLVPAGVDYGLFEAVRLGQDPPPVDLAGFARPLVGYVGGLNHRVDEALLVDLAARYRSVTFVFVGPVEIPMPRLAACLNVRMVGPRPHADVPRYLKAFDAALVPYHRTTYTDHIYPAKLNEYLAMGLPVVATALLEMRRFVETHGPVVHVASDTRAFGDALGVALAERDPDLVRRRLDVARGNAWDVRFAQIAGLVENALAARHRHGAPGGGAGNAFA